MDVTISRDDLWELVRLAENNIIAEDDDYSVKPTDADRVFMLRMWKLAGKEVPGWFRRKYGWTQE